VGHPWWGIAGALAIELVRNLVNLHQFDHWLRNRNRRDPPDAGGLWGDLVSQVSRLHHRKQFHKKRLLSLFGSCAGRRARCLVAAWRWTPPMKSGG